MVLVCQSLMRCLWQLTPTIRKEVKFYEQSYKHSVPLAPLAQVEIPKVRGHRFILKTSPETFSNIEYHFDQLKG